MHRFQPQHLDVLTDTHIRLMFMEGALYYQFHNKYNYKSQLIKFIPIRNTIVYSINIWIWYKTLILLLLDLQKLSHSLFDELQILFISTFDFV